MPRVGGDRTEKQKPFLKNVARVEAKAKQRWLLIRDTAVRVETFHHNNQQHLRRQLMSLARLLEFICMKILSMATVPCNWQFLPKMDDLVGNMVLVNCYAR